MGIPACSSAIIRAAKGGSASPRMRLGRRMAIGASKIRKRARARASSRHTPSPQAATQARKALSNSSSSRSSAARCGAGGGLSSNSPTGSCSSRKRARQPFSRDHGRMASAASRGRPARSNGASARTKEA